MKRLVEDIIVELVNQLVMLVARSISEPNNNASQISDITRVDKNSRT